VSDDHANVLVVANETLAGRELIGAVEQRAAQSPIRVLVVAPVNDPVAGYVVYEGTRRASAGRRLDRALQALRELGVPAYGYVSSEGPLDAVRDALAQEDIDELIVSTHPEARSGWLRRNLLDEIRRAAGRRPVEHVVGDVALESGAVNVLVVANETVLGEQLLDAIRERAAKDPAVSFLIVSPQSDSIETIAAGHPDAERRLRSAVGELRSEGLDVHGQIAHPDPYTATMEMIHDERVDELIVSTFPGERSGWLRRDLVGRLRSDSGVPVQHVVVEARVEAVA
jgi:phosphopantetheine adenylyltransferase